MLRFPRLILAWSAFALGAFAGENRTASAKRPPSAALLARGNRQTVPAYLHKPRAERHATTEPTPSMDVLGARFTELAALHIVSINTGQALHTQLYDPQGKVDEDVAERLDELLGDHRDPAHPESIKLERRTLQLLFRAAYHFKAQRVEVVSAYRKPGRKREGPHAAGRALDFKLPGVSVNTLAAYLRKLARVGVGVYTNPKTQFVHLDSREQSFHWLDASPPNRSWRERALQVPQQQRVRDAAYAAWQDWPEQCIDSGRQR